MSGSRRSSRPQSRTKRRSCIVTHVRARGRGSGIIVDAHGASIWKLRDGLVTRATLYQDKDEALEALRTEQAGT